LCDFEAGASVTALTTLYRTDPLTVTDYDCDHPRGGRNVEEASDKDEFVFVLRGIYQKRSSDGSVILDPSQIAVFRKGQPYCITHPVEGGDRSIIVQFDPADLCAALDTEPDSSGTALHRVPATFVVTAPLILLAGRLCHGVRQAAQDGFRIEETAYALLDGLSDIAARMRQSPLAMRAQKPCALDVGAVVSSRFRQKLSIGGIAQMLEVSPFHLCRSFRAATGITIHHYVTILRMSEAVHRLWSYRTNLTELALDLGYSSHSHFSSTFRHFFGITPSQLMTGSPTRLGDIERNLRGRKPRWR
jgi:AraC-like DNA-binding protein